MFFMTLLELRGDSNERTVNFPVIRFLSPPNLRIREKEQLMGLLISDTRSLQEEQDREQEEEEGAWEIEGILIETVMCKRRCLWGGWEWQ